MKLQTVLLIVLVSSLAINTEGKILKKLLKKKLALVAGLKKLASGGSGQKGPLSGLLSPQTAPIGQTDNSLGTIVPLSETVQSEIIDEAALVEQVHPIPAPVAVYSSYVPEYRSPIYYRASQPAVVRRTVYQYVDAPRSNLAPQSGSTGNTADLSRFSIPGLSNIPVLGQLSNLKRSFNGVLNLLSAPAPAQQVAPAPVGATSAAYISYPPYYN